MRKKLIISISIIIFVVLISGLLAPRSNPPVENKVVWDSVATRDQFMKSCADCHSHETKWPWYSYVGPTAFLVTNDVREAREHFNISTPNMRHARDAAEEVRDGYMPPSDYLFMHDEARLQGEIRNSFASGLEKTFGGKNDRRNDEDEME